MLVQCLLVDVCVRRQLGAHSLQRTHQHAARLAAVLGGCQSLHTNSRDEALALPAEDAARLALRTQQIIAYESGVPDAVDPLGGSYFIEQFTDEIERKATEYVRKIDGMGGAIRAIEQQYYQTEIADSAYKYQQSIERNEKVVVGMNEFVMEEAVRPQLFKIDEGVRAEQVRRLQTLKSRRDEKKVQSALETLASEAAGTNNVLPFILIAVESDCTLGEISDTFRRVWGEY